MVGINSASSKRFRVSHVWGDVEIFKTKRLGGDLDGKIDFQIVKSGAVWYFENSNILNEIYGGDIDEKIDFHTLQSRALWYFKWLSGG